jgi:hypothetical protein
MTPDSSTTVDRLAAALTDRYRVDRELGAGGMATPAWTCGTRIRGTLSCGR